MATWHQQQARRRAGFRLYHETKWAVVTDPPVGMSTIYLCDTKEKAEQVLQSWLDNGKGKYSYILPPSEETST